MANSRDSYDSEGKCQFLRPTWERESKKLARELNRPLDAIWLSDRQFTDIQPICSLFREILVAENGPTALTEKRDFLSHAPAAFSSVVKIPSRPMTMLQLVEDLVARGRKIDIANFDFCTHLDSHVVETLSAALRGRLVRRGGLIFMTVARNAQSCMNKDNYERQRLAGTIEGVNQQIAAEFSKDHVNAETLPGFPYFYDGRNSKRCPMFSFGWRVRSYAGAKQALGIEGDSVSVREKHAIVRLRRAGFPAKAIAGAFVVSPGTVAALLAWYTMRGQKASSVTAAQSSLPGGGAAASHETVGILNVDILSEREKHTIACLRLAGLPKEAIAEAFAIRTGTVSALLAHYTRGKGNQAIQTAA